MTEQEKKEYKEQMITQAKAYAIKKLEDIKDFIDENDYVEMVLDLTNTFLAGVDANVSWFKNKNFHYDTRRNEKTNARRYESITA